MSVTQLTIAIPTYKREAKLAAQLKWIANAIKGHEDAVEVLVSDNCSPDGTQGVIAEWQIAIGKDSTGRQILRSNLNSRNIGAVGNVSRCMELASSRYVWVIGDDDAIRDDAVGFVLGSLRANPKLVSILLNFNSTGKTVYDRCFDFPKTEIRDGKQVVQEILPKAHFSLAFTTAQVYRSDLAKNAINAWRSGLGNFDFQIYITAAVAAHGQMLVTRENYVTYVTGENVYETNPHAALRVAGDSSEVMVRLVGIGYPRSICSGVVRHNARRFNHRFIRRAVRRPISATPVVVRYLRSFLAVHLAQTQNEIRAEMQPQIQNA